MDESAAELTKGVLAGAQRALARAASLVENGRAAELLREIAPVAGRALIIGVTGAPGVGKSTLCDQIIKILRSEGKTVGVIAVDPSSPYSGGAILGDRIRMQQHHADPGVFIRSMAARGVSGGLAQATADLATLLDAAGRDVVIIETVGVGQGEIDIVSLAQVILVVLTPGAGDEPPARSGTSDDRIDPRDGGGAGRPRPRDQPGAGVRGMHGRAWRATGGSRATQSRVGPRPRIRLIPASGIATQSGRLSSS